MTSPELGPFRNILDEAFEVTLSTEPVTPDGDWGPPITHQTLVAEGGDGNVVWTAPMPHGWTPPLESRHWCDGLEALRDVCSDLRAVEALRDFADLYRADFDSARDRLAASWPTADDLLEARRLERVAP